jgi:hypothetical protein
MSVDRSRVKPGHRDHWYMRGSLPVYDSGSETGNKVLSMDHAMRELYVTNDNLENEMTILVEGEAGLSLTFTLKPDEYLDERLPEFLTVTVTSVGAWRWMVRSGLIP